MDIVEKYRQQAEECEAIAQRASTESQRQRIMGIAQVWRKLASDRERMIQSAEDVSKAILLGDFRAWICLQTIGAGLPNVTDWLKRPSPKTTGKRSYASLHPGENSRINGSACL